MKNNRISTRVLAVFAAVLLITALSVPAFAATSYVFDNINEPPWYYADFALPEGDYYVTIQAKYSGIDFVLDSINPISVSYLEQGPFAGFSTFFSSNSPFTVSPAFDDIEITDVFLLGSCDEMDTYGRYVLVGECPLGTLDTLGATITFTPVNTPISLTDYISADALPAVFNEIISLLPLAPGALVGFIAIRKAIAYLQNVLHSS